MSDFHHGGTKARRDRFPSPPDAGCFERKPFNPTRVFIGRGQKASDKILSVASGSIPKPARADLARCVQRQPVSVFPGCYLRVSVTPVVNLFPVSFAGDGNSELHEKLTFFPVECQAPKLNQNEPTPERNLKQEP